jgi:activator of HSP90 ATPase
MQHMTDKMTRRGVALTLGGIAAAPLDAQSKGDGTSVHQEVDFKAAPTRVYDALLDAKQFAAFTKDKAEIERQVGGSFKLFGGRIEGRTIELALNQRIVQVWRATDWKPGFYTIIKFALVARGSGTRIVFDQAGFLEDDAEWKSLKEGWPQMYWEPLRKYLDK